MHFGRHRTPSLHKGAQSVAKAGWCIEQNFDGYKYYNSEVLMEVQGLYIVVCVGSFFIDSRLPRRKKCTDTTIHIHN